MRVSGQNASDVYRVIVLGRNGTEVLVVPEGVQHGFPLIEIPRDQRAAENVSAQFRAVWGEEIICILSQNDNCNYQVAEYWRNVGKAQKQTKWTAVESLPKESFVKRLDYEQLQKAIKKVREPKGDKMCEPFARLGWFRELCAWAEMAAGSIGIQPNGNFRQLNAGESFSLIRFETNGPALWFKAVGEPNQREFPVTMTLAELFPDYLPAVLASHAEWNGWLMQEVEGDTLEPQDLRSWSRAVSTLAELQMASMPYASRIRAAGAHDLAAVRLSELVSDFITTLAYLMSLQTKVPPAVLSQEQLATLGQDIHEALETLDSAHLPNALGHLDLNPWNIIISPDECRFLDWAEAYVGIPFLSFQYVLEHYRRTPAARADRERLLTDEYYQPWRRVISPVAISEVLPFLPMLAAFACAVADEAWRDPSRLKEPGYEGYLRSLTRRMFREANAVKERRTLCSA